ncbi:MAG: M1 family aminopeptidase, partial [Pseudomonadota bacterium]
RLETTQLIGSPAFLVLSLLTSFLLIAGLVAGDGFYGTRSWPLTRMLSESIQGGLSLLILIVLSYYAAEAVWRERQVGVSPLVDAAPVHNAVLYLSKLIALWAVIIGLCGVGVCIAVIYQTASGYTDYEWSVYAQTLSLQYLLPAMFVAVLSMLVQIVSPNKYVGMLVFAAYVVASLVLPQLGLEHHLWRYSEGPEAIYSDMNGLGHFLSPLVSYHVYWGVFAAALVIVGYGLWPRGVGIGLLARARATRATVGRSGALVLALCLAAFAATGTYIHHNTNVLNDYRSADAALDWRADYERELKGFETTHLPTIRAVIVDVAIYPESRRVAASGQYRLRNETAAPIGEFLLSWETKNDVAFTLESGRVTQTFEALGAVLVTLDEPLAPGAERRLEFAVDRRNVGFREREVDNRIVANGTFINNQELLPRIGYDADQELQDARDRAERGLGDWSGLADLDDESQYGRTYLGADVHRVDLDITVSTHADQTAIAPGRLLREWVDGERRFFHYRTDRPVLNFFAVLSGHYAVESVVHNDVEIAVYHHPKHDMNVDRMIEATRDALDYFGAEFGPYQYQHVRIIEFPRYETFAQSFANTIPYSEDIGFVADLRDASTIDYVYSVTAHELAHQWWGHQIAPANVQGGTVLSESLAQYSAYMLIQHRYGPAYLRRFLKWELDRYLRGRSNETDEEQVLMRAENKSYIHYQKGGLILYALQDVMGTDRLHAALRDLLDSYRDNSQVFPTTRDLLARLRAVADPASEAFIEDGFERIMIYDFSIASAVGRELPSGGFEIDVTLNAGRADATGGGRGTPVELDERIEIGLLRAHPDAPLTADDVLNVSVSRLTDGRQSLILHSDVRPEFVTVDPFLKRIDRDTEDNTIAVSWSD